MHGRRVSDRVRINRFCLDGGALILGGRPVFVGDIADAEASDGSAIGVKKQAFNSRLFRGSLIQVRIPLKSAI